MRWYLDTEFNEDDLGSSIDLISVALVSDDGREYYAHCDCYSPGECNDWVKKHVLPHVKDMPRKPASVVAKEITELVGDGPEFWGYYADYDWVMLCKLFGTMMKLPTHFPKFCMDVRQRMKELGVTRPELPDQNDRRHDALGDARWIRQANHELDKVRARRLPPLYVFTNTVGAVVAFSLDDAISLWEQKMSAAPVVWDEQADDDLVRIRCFDHGIDRLQGLEVSCSAPAAEWIRRYGRCVLGEVVRSG